MRKTHDNRLPLWWLVRAADMPLREITPLVKSLGLYVYQDEETGQCYTSRSEFGNVLRSLAAVDSR